MSAPAAAARSWCCCRRERDLSETDRALVEIFGSRLSIAFDNVILYQQLHEANTQLEDRVAQRTRALMPANRRLSAQWLRLQRANGFKNEILGTVAHDLKNPLGVILGRTEMLTELIGAGSPEGKHHRPGRSHPRRHQAADLDGRPPDFGRDGGRLRHHHSPRAGRYRGAWSAKSPRPISRSAVNKQQTIDGVGAAAISSPCAMPTGCARRSTTSSATPSNTARSAARSRWWSAMKTDNTMIRIADEGAGPVAGRSRAAVRPLPAAVRQAHRRRKLDRPRPVDRQAHHRHAWRQGDRRQRRPRPGIDLHHHVARDGRDLT